MIESLGRPDVRFFLTWSAVVGWALIGLLALGVSLRKRCHDRAVWIGIAILSIIFSVEMAFPHRYVVTEGLRQAMKSVGGDEAIRGRRPIQAALIGFVVVVVIGLLVKFLFYQNKIRTPGKFAVLGIGLAVFGFFLETVSLHQLDDYAFVYFALFNIGVIISFLGFVSQLTMSAGLVPSGVASSGSRAGNDWRIRSSGVGRPRATSTEPGHATYRVGQFDSKPVRRRVESRETVLFVLAVACVLYVFGHARVEGQEPAKFIGGLGSALLFGSVGAVVAGSPRRSLARSLAFGLAFGVLGITFNLAMHPTTRPFWSADILQGMALSGMVLAVWRRLTGGGAWAYAGLVALASIWWVVEPFARAWPGSQYLFATGSGVLSLFPVLPWLTLAALGAWLVEVSVVSRLTIALVLAILAAQGWSLGPVKFPLNPIYALAGGSLASAVFALAEFAHRSVGVRVATDWLGGRWLIFFYLHLGIAPVLERFGMVGPVVGWSSLALVAIAATWVVAEILYRLRGPFAWPVTWAVLLVGLVAVGFTPGLPGFVIVGLAGGIGLLFASRYDDLADLILGPTLDDLSPASRLSDGWLRYLARVALVVALLIAPEAVSRLPKPFGQASRPEPRPPISATEAAGSISRPAEQPGDL